MPEGHVIHRWARLHQDALGGRTVRAWSPQGRFAEGAALLDGRMLADVEAYGKHLFYRWNPAATLHIHLGLIGRFRMVEGEEPAPTAGTRLAMAVADPLVRVDLAGPIVCQLIDPEDEDAIRARLGPDPLRDDADPERVWTALHQRGAPIGAALVDQAVIAGVGNAYRAEALFVSGIDPDTPARDLDRATFDRLWKQLMVLMREGERNGRIATVGSDQPGADETGRFVYSREGRPCLRCGSALRTWNMTGRRITACPVCQRAAG